MDRLFNEQQNRLRLNLQKQWVRHYQAENAQQMKLTATPLVPTTKFDAVMEHLSKSIDELDNVLTSIIKNESPEEREARIQREIKRKYMDLLKDYNKAVRSGTIRKQDATLNDMLKTRLKLVAYLKNHLKLDKSDLAVLQEADELLNDPRATQADKNTVIGLLADINREELIPSSSDRAIQLVLRSLQKYGSVEAIPHSEVEKIAEASQTLEADETVMDQPERKRTGIRPSETEADRFSTYTLPLTHTGDDDDLAQRMKDLPKEGPTHRSIDDDRRAAMKQLVDEAQSLGVDITKLQQSAKEVADALLQTEKKMRGADRKNAEDAFTAIVAQAAKAIADVKAAQKPAPAARSSSHVVSPRERKERAVTSDAAPASSSTASPLSPITEPEPQPVSRSTSSRQASRTTTPGKTSKKPPAANRQGKGLPRGIGKF